MPEGSFPQSLLQQPVEARMAYFRSFTIAHPRLKEADAALKQAIQDPAGWSLIFVYGPTGVGKTTLRLWVEKHLKQSLLATLRDDPGRIPVISIEAAADSAQFSWKDYYRRPDCTRRAFGRSQDQLPRPRRVPGQLGETYPGFAGSRPGDTLCP